MQSSIIASITHIIYDLDGLLLNTEPFYTQFNQTFVSRYGKVFDWSMKAKMLGKNAQSTARILVESLELPVTPEDYLREREIALNQLFPLAQPMPGTVRLTKYLHQHHIPQAVATSSARPTFQLKIREHQEWFRIFDPIVTGDDPAIKQGKPAPDIFLLAAQRLRTNPKTCLVFEDSPAGMTAARSAGMWVVGVPDANLDRQLCKDAHQLLDSITDFDPPSWQLPAFSDLG